VLEKAVWLARGVWLAIGMAGIAVRVRRGDRPALPKDADPWMLVEVGVAAYAAEWASEIMSRACHNADRGWHIPLVTSLRGQQLPFTNVYGGLFGYHYSGDVVAAAIQTLSSDALHASYALTLAHDAFFALTGATMALVVRGLGVRGPTIAALAGLGVLLTGPLDVMVEDPTLTSYSVVSFYRISFRPHVSLAGLLVTGLLAAALARLDEGKIHPTRPHRAIVPAMVALVAAMSITDEATIGLLGLLLGAMWLVEPRVFGARWWHGLVWLGALLVAVVVPQVIFSGSLSGNAPHHAITRVDPRAPGYYRPTLPLLDERGRTALLHDVVPQLTVLLAGIATLLRVRTRAALATVVGALVVYGVGYYGLTRLDIDELPVENHRFWTAAMLVMPVFGTAWAIWSRDALPRALVVGGLVMSGVSSLSWAKRPIVPGNRRLCSKVENYGSKFDFYAIDCRPATLVRPFEKPQKTYVEKSVAYLWLGCHPSYTAGPPATHWKDTAIGLAQTGREALLQLHASMGAEEPLFVVCPRGNSNELVCRAAIAEKRCKAMGNVQRCEFSGAGRAALVASLGGAPLEEGEADEPALPVEPAPSANAVPSASAASSANAVPSASAVPVAP